MNDIAVITTFGNNSWQVYAKKMLESYVQFWPAEIALLVQVDDDLLVPDINKILRPQDGLAVGRLQAHEDFLKRNAGKTTHRTIACNQTGSVIKCSLFTVPIME